MKKYLLDTSVLIHDALSLFVFKDNHIYICREVVLELAKKREEKGIVGKQAREAIALLKNIFMRNCNLTELIEEKFKPIEEYTVELNTGTKITLYQDLDYFSSKKFFKENVNEINNGIKHRTDMRLIEIAKKIGAILVTKDYTLQLFALQNGVPAEDYKKDKIETFYSGYKTVNTLSKDIDQLYKTGNILLDNYDLTPNEFVVLTAYEDPNKTALGQYKSPYIYLIKEERVHDITPKNKEQIFALNLLMDPEIEFVTLTGSAGTGKTLLALAAGLEQVQKEIYKKILIARPIAEDELGFLPGELEDKLRPWVQPIYDSIEVLYDQNPDFIIEELKERNKMEIQALQHLRGRSIPKQYFLIDEAQNLTPKQAKLIASRAGHGTKIVMVGDIDQIDQPYLDKYTNGITHIINGFKGQDNYGHISLAKSDVRSRLAEQAARLL